MTRFDWEPRTKPQGLVDIERTQKREETDRKLREYTAESKLYKIRSQWEVNSLEKAKYVAQTLAGAQESQRPLDSSTSPQPRPLVADELRKEAEERKTAKEAEKAAASRRRDALLQQAAASREAKRREQLTEASRKALLDESPEFREHMRAAQAKQQAAIWNKQVEDKREAALKLLKEEQLTSGGSNILTSIGERDTKYISDLKYRLQNDLDRQVEEAEQRKAEEDRKNTILLAQLQTQWQRENEIADQSEQETKLRQLEFNQMASKVAGWRKDEASRRAAAAAELEHAMMAASRQHAEHDVSLTAELRGKRKNEAEAQFDAWLEARERAVAADIVAEKELLHRQELEQRQR